MKKEYMKPTMFVVKLQHQNLLLEVSGGDTGLSGGNEPGTGGGRSRHFDAWEDNWDEGWDKY